MTPLTVGERPQRCDRCRRYTTQPYLLATHNGSDLHLCPPCHAKRNLPSARARQQTASG